MLKPLSERKQKILDYICNHIEQKKYSPSVREIGEYVGLRSSSTTKGYLDRLKADGYVTWEEGKSRTLRLMKHTSSV
jgi:SOS-response transcriptional repressor LexA